MLRAKSRPSHRRMLTAVSLAAVINGLCSFCRGSLPASDSDHHRSVLPASGLVISEPMLPGHHSCRAPRSLSVLRSSLSEPDEHSPLLSGLGSFCDCRQCRAPRPRRCLRVTYVRWWTSSAMLISLWSPECVPFASSSRDHSRHFGQCSGSLSQSAGVGGVAGASSCRMSVSDTLYSVPGSLVHVHNW